MNYLGHLLLSGKDEHIIVGNFLTDIMNLDGLQKLPEAYTRGMELHRHIDTYTDSNPYFKKSLKILYPLYGKYAAVAFDVVIDYYLTQDWMSHSEESYEAFKNRIYKVLEAHMIYLDNHDLHHSQKMIDADWLNQYLTWSGIQDVFRRLDQRASFPSYFEKNANELLRKEVEIKEGFSDFISTVKESCQEFILQN